MLPIEYAEHHATHDPRMATMLALHKQTHWPIAYLDDIHIHDRATLAEYPGSMVWILREMGTHTYPLAEMEYPPRAELRKACEWHSGDHPMNHYRADDPTRPLFFRIDTDGSYTSITPQEAIDLFESPYQENPVKC